MGKVNNSQKKLIIVITIHNASRVTIVRAGL